MSRKEIPERPPVIDQYRKICKEIADLTKQQKILKEKVRPLVEESGGWPDCYLQESNKTDYVDEVILKWIKEEYPELVKEILVEKVRWDKFKSLLNLRVIDIYKMPKDCSIETKSYSLITARQRKKPEDED
jgi:hypothetical protein